MAAMYFSQTLLVFWLYKNNFGFSSLIIYYISSFLFALLGILYLPKKTNNSKRNIFLGTLFSALSIFVLIKIFNPWQLLISAIFTGLNVVYFWITYNIMHFKYSSEGKRGLNSGIYFLITPIIGITLQPLAGIVAEKFGFTILFFIGMLLYSIPIFLIRYLPSFDLNLDVKKGLKNLKFNGATFLQGATSRVNYSLIPIFSLFFLKTPRQFGNFFGYLAIIAALASVFNGYISDKIKNRKVFFYLFTSLAVISFLPLAYINNIYYWGIFAGISSLCMNLVNPFWLTFNLDFYKEIGVDKTMILREVFLNMGYIFTLLVVFIVFYFTSSTQFSLIIITILCCFLPIVSYLQGVYRNKNYA